MGRKLGATPGFGKAGTRPHFDIRALRAMPVFTKQKSPGLTARTFLAETRNQAAGL